jgi:hypothetical protein
MSEDGERDLHHKLLLLERKLLEHVEKMGRADRRSEIRDRNNEIRLERLECLERTVVGLLRDILRELRREHPATFPRTTGISVRPHPGGQ